MSTSRALRRAEHEVKAAKTVEQNWDMFRRFLDDALTELGDEIDGLPAFQQDVRLAGEISYKIDAALKFDNEIIEALDGVVAWFIALAVIGVYRAVQKRSVLTRKRLAAVQVKLANVDTMLPKVRKRVENRKAKLERRIKRLENR